MNTTKKLAIAVVALSLALVLVVGGTLAFLVATSDTVTNTFTYGDIELKLWENEKTNVTGLDFSDVVPGQTVDKRPSVTVVKDSENCYVYVLIDNQLDTAATYTIENTWEEVTVKEFANTTKKLYRYKEVVKKDTEKDTDLLVFDGMIFDVNLTDLAGLESKKVVLVAYAHQAANTDQATADAAAIDWAENVQ